MRPMLQGMAAIMVLAAASGAVAGSRGLPPEAKLAKMLEGRTAGQPLHCINPRNTDTVEIIDKTAIVYRMTNGMVYVNRPNRGAADLDRENTIVTRTVGAQLCSNDVVTLLEPGSRFQSGFASLGEFVPYAKVRK